MASLQNIGIENNIIILYPSNKLEKYIINITNNETIRARKILIEINSFIKSLSLFIWVINEIYFGPFKWYP